MGDERDRLNNIIDDHGLKIGHVQVMERRNESYARVYDALAAKLAEVTAERDAWKAAYDKAAEMNKVSAGWHGEALGRAEAAEAAMKTAKRDALEEAAKVADEAYRRMEGRGLTHPENSESRDFCFGRAREAMNISINIRDLIDKEETKG